MRGLLRAGQARTKAGRLRRGAEASSWTRHNLLQRCRSAGPDFGRNDASIMTFRNETGFLAPERPEMINRKAGRDDMPNALRACPRRRSQGLVGRRCAARPCPADETYAFIIGLHASATFEFTRLCRWLRAYITNDASW